MVKTSLRNFFCLAKEAFTSLFGTASRSTAAASLQYYAIFSLPGLLVIVINLEDNLGLVTLKCCKVLK